MPVKKITALRTWGLISPVLRHRVLYLSIMVTKSISCRFVFMKKCVLFFFFLFVLIARLQAQDTLPKFSVKNVGGNRIVIGWLNKFESVKQISIQRSFDSLRNFKTILTVPDPTIPENGYVDTKASNERMFYRLYIMLDKGQ